MPHAAILPVSCQSMSSTAPSIRSASSGDVAGFPIVTRSDSAAPSGPPQQDPLTSASSRPTRRSETGRPGREFAGPRRSAGSLADLCFLAGSELSPSRSGNHRSVPTDPIATWGGWPEPLELPAPRLRTSQPTMPYGLTSGNQQPSSRIVGEGPSGRVGERWCGRWPPHPHTAPPLAVHLSHGGLDLRLALARAEKAIGVWDRLGGDEVGCVELRAAFDVVPLEVDMRVARNNLSCVVGAGRLRRQSDRRDHAHQRRSRQTHASCSPR